MNKESKRNEYFKKYMENGLFTKEAAEEKPDDKLMESEEFKENFAENYKEITENEEEMHKEELKAEGFYENAIDEAFNKAIEETKAEIRPITTEVEDILGSKCASEAVSGLYKEAARKMDKVMFSIIKDLKAKESALAAAKKSVKGSAEPNMVELTKAKNEYAAAKQKFNEMSRFYKTHGIDFTESSKVNKIEKGLMGQKRSKAYNKDLKPLDSKREVKNMDFTHSVGVKDKNGMPTGDVTRVTDKVKRAIYTGDENKILNRRSTNLRNKVIKEELKGKEPTQRVKYNPSMPSPGNTTIKEETPKAADGIKSKLKKALPYAGAGVLAAGTGVGAYQAGKNKGQNQGYAYGVNDGMQMGALASEVSEMFEKTASAEPTLTEKVSYVMDGGMEKEAFLPAALVRGGIAAAKGINRGIKAAGGLKGMNMSAIGNTFKRGGSAFKNSFAHDAGAQNAIKAGNWIKQNPKKSIALGGAGAFGLGAASGAKQNPNGMQQTLASEVSEMFEKTAKKVPFPKAKSLRNTAEAIKKANL